MQESSLQRSALITGGASGIGFATARAFLTRGHRVALVDNDVERLQAAAAELGSLGEVTTVAADVADKDRACEAVAYGATALGSLHVVVNSAGILGSAAFLTDDVELLERVVAVNLLGTMWINRAAVIHLKKRGGGVIVNVASISALTGSPEYPAYAASKAGIVGLTKSLARKYARNRIRVNCIAPGSVIGTRLLERSRGRDVTSVERLALIKKIPLGMIPTPSDMAETIVFLASPAAAMITGAVLVSDGGEALER